MAIKYLRGQSGLPTVPVKTTRPTGFKFPVGLTASNDLNQANSATTSTGGTFDLLIVAGGGAGGVSNGGTYYGGGGGGGGVRILSANSFSDLSENKNPNFITEITNFIPVIVGGGSAASCFGTAFSACQGGGGGPGFGSPGGTGGSGGGGGRWTRTNPPPYNTCGAGGAGIVGQGCCGTAAGPGSNGGAGGAAACSLAAPAVCNCNGLTTSFTGTSVRFSDGGNGSSTPLNGTPGTANRGNGGNAGAQDGLPGGSGGSGIVAIRYRNPAAPTTPLATGGNCICCTGGCIIHIFTSSGFLNVNSSFSIN
jgi:hypothetical protein